MASTSQHAVEARDLAVVYRDGDRAVVALAELDLEVRPNEFVSIIGPSGCGKSTFLKAMADLIAPSAVQGSLSVCGMSPAAARRRNSFAFVFQDPVLAPWRTVLDNVALPLEIVHSDKRSPQTSAQALVELVGLTEFANALPHQLSGGMKQRVALARALTLKPQILLMDEPFGALDELTRDRMQDELLSILANAEATVLFVTHSIAEAVYLSDRILVMTPAPGRISEVITIDFERPRSPLLKTTVPFLEKANAVRAALG